MGLEDTIREAAKRGLTHLSLHPVHSEDSKTVYWRCTATPSTMHKYVHVTELDPVAAIEAVLKAMPKAGRRTPTSATGAPTPATDDGLTAAVTEPIDMDESKEALAKQEDEWSRFK